MGPQIRAARGLLGWTQAELAEAAGVGLSTVYTCESERLPVSPESIAKMRTALERGGIEFIDGKRAGVRLR